MEWERRIELLRQKYGLDSVERQIVLPPPKSDTHSEGLPLGICSYPGQHGAPFILDMAELTRHMGIFGSTGSGKTSLAKNILRDLSSRNIPFIVFDWECNYRDLLHEVKNVKVFTVGSKCSPFYFNYLEVPPGLTYQEYIKSVVDVFNRAYVGGAGTDAVLLKALDRAYLENRLPTTQDVRDILSEGMKGNLRGREMLWKQSSMRMFDFLCYGGTGSLLDIRENLKPSKLFNDCIIFELGALSSPYDKRFFVEMFTLWYWLHLEHQGIEHETLKHVLLFEEFHNILSAGSKDDSILKMFRQIRKYGTGLIVLDQTPSLIPNPIFENLYTKISFTLNHAQNVRAIADAMFMKPHEREFLGLLKTGQAICRIAARHTEPFLLDIPFIKTTGDASDEDVARHMSRFSLFSDRKKPSRKDSSTLRTIHKDESLSPLAKILLEDIAKTPFVGMAKRYKTLGLSAAQGTEVQKELVSKRFAEPLTVARHKFLVPNDAGKRLLKKWSVPYKLGSGRGGFEHSYYVDRIKNHLVDAGGFAFIEQDDIDLVAYKLDGDGEQIIAVQVETGKSNIKKNLVTLAEYEASARFMVATNKHAETVIKQAHEASGKNIRDTVAVMSGQTFLRQHHFS